MIWGCNPKVTKNSSIPENAVARYFLKNADVGVFREADFNDEPDVILLLEDYQNMIYFDSSHVIFRYYLGAERYYVLNYVFENKKLKEIWFDLFVDTDKDAEVIANDFTGFFDKKYGSHFVEMGYNVWLIQDSTKKQTGIINLSDESAEYGYGKLNLTIYKNPL